MLVKIIGSVLLALSGVVASVSLCRYCRRRLDTLDGFIALIFYIKGQVECYARPIGEILATLSPEILRDCNCPTGVASIEELIGESRIYLDRESLRLVSAFSMEFGSVFREEQSKRCDYYISLLNERRALISSRLLPEMRAGSAVCICSSLCWLILLW